MLKQIKQHSIVAAIIPLLIIVFLFTGCTGIGLPIIGSSYTQSENKIGVPDYLIVKFYEVYRGGQPTSKGFEYLKKINIKTIVKLNSDNLEQERREAKKLNMNLEMDLIEPDNLLNMSIIPDQFQVSKAMKTIMNHYNWPIYVHCKNGWDRTGLIIAMYRVCHDNYSKEDAYNEMIMNGFSSSHRVLLTGIQEYWDKFDVNICENWRSK